MSFIFIIAVAVVGWLLYQQYYKVLMKQGKVGQIKLALIVVGLIFLALAVTGRAPALFAILGAAMTQVMRFAPLLLRFAPSLKKAYTTAGNSHGNDKSHVVTNTLKMTLDHASGTMDGEVLAGTLSGRYLQTLSITELQALHQYCRQHDVEAERLLMSFIARERAESWSDTSHDRNGESQPGSGTDTGNAGPMGTSEAIAILGLEEPFTKQDVTKAHRSLMGKFHPDKGGNNYLAVKLNNARDLLLEYVKRR